MRRRNGRRKPTGSQTCRAPSRCAERFVSEHACVHEDAPRRCNPCMLYISPLWTLSWEKPLPLPTRIYKPMETLLHNIAIDVATCESIERNLRGKAAAAKINLRKNATPRDVKEVVQTCVEACRKSRKRYHEENGPGPDTSDEALSQYTRFTDHSALHVYRQFLWYAPRLVNVVTLAEAIPMPGSGISLPLNLGLIASLCKGSYYAPKRFAVRLPWSTPFGVLPFADLPTCSQAVQLAYSNPRCRVLVFRTSVGSNTATLLREHSAGAQARHRGVLQKQTDLVFYACAVRYWTSCWNRHRWGRRSPRRHRPRAAAARSGGACELARAKLRGHQPGRRLLPKGNSQL